MSKIDQTKWAEAVANDPFLEGANLDLSATPSLTNMHADDVDAWTDKNFGSRVDMRGSGVGSNRLKDFIRTMDRDTASEVSKDFLEAFDKENAQKFITVSGKQIPITRNKHGEFVATLDVNGKPRSLQALSFDELVSQITTVVSQEQAKKPKPYSGPRFSREETMFINTVADYLIKGDESTARIYLSELDFNAQRHELIWQEANAVTAAKIFVRDNPDYAQIPENVKKLNDFMSSRGWPITARNLSLAWQQVKKAEQPTPPQVALQSTPGLMPRRNETVTAEDLDSLSDNQITDQFNRVRRARGLGTI